MTRTRSNRARILAAVATVLAVLGLAGCASVEVIPAIGNCSPSFVVKSSYGNFSIQQSGYNSPVQWGAYPNKTYSGDYYTAAVYVDGLKVDQKSQSYPPHGSISTQILGHSRDIFAVIGNVYIDGSLVLHYEMRCRLA